jgi:hypothetical protein
VSSDIRALYAFPSSIALLHPTRSPVRPLSPSNGQSEVNAACQCLGLAWAYEADLFAMFFAAAAAIAGVEAVR